MQTFINQSPKSVVTVMKRAISALRAGIGLVAGVAAVEFFQFAQYTPLHKWMAVSAFALRTIGEDR